MSWEQDKYFFHMSPQCCRRIPFIAISLSMYTKICLRHKLRTFLAKLALIFLYNFHREHSLLNLVVKKLSPKINVKNIKTRV